jgi:hypothetical protein
MTASHVQTPAARKAASLQQATLDALAGIASDVVREQLGDVAGRMAAALADVSEPGLDTREVYRRVKSGKLLKENSYAFIHLASTGIELALRKELDGLRPAPPQGKPAPALGLVPLAEMDDKIAFGTLARPFDIAHSEGLATLSVRLGMLLGRGVLRADSNPFRPAVFLKALEEAWREFEPEAEAHALVLPLLRPGIVFDFAPLLERLAEALQRKDGQPGSVDAYRIQKTDDAAAARAARAGAKAALAEQLRKLFGDDGGDDGVPLIPDLPGLPSGNGGWRPSGAAAFRGPAPPQPQTQPQPQGGPAAAPGGVAPAPAAAVQPAPGFAPASASGAVQPAPGFAPVHPVATGQPAPGVGAAPGVLFAPAPAASTVPGAQWAGIPVQGLIAAASGTGAPPVAAGLAGGMAGTALAGAAPLLDLLASIEPALAPMDAGGNDGAGAPLPQNVFYLPRLKQSLPRGSLSRGDQRTLDLLSRVFETVLLDDSMPSNARALLQALQVPVLRAALLDKRFFFEETHPARRLVDLLSKMGWEQRQDADDPMFQAMQRSVARVAQAGPMSMPDQADGDAGFAGAVAELEASIAAEQSAEEAALQAPVASALKQETLAVATRAARDAVALRLKTGDLPGDAGEVVGGFLEQRWTTVLTFAHTIEGEKPGAVSHATRAMDDLIWSVKPKVTQEQRKALIGKLPRLLATLNKWLDAIRWQDGERLQFFARLAECHASIVRAPIELSPERQLELAVEAAQQDALRRVELENAAAEQAAARRQEVSPVDGLERGMWCEFRNAEGLPEGARKVKLAWVSPLRTLFIFSGAGRREAFSMSAEQLAAALHSGAARVLAIDGVVGQVLFEAMQRGADNDAVMSDASMRGAAAGAAV